MLKDKLLKELEYLNLNIDLTDFDSIFVGLKYQLRFELGEPYKNGTKKRVNQSTKRASELFENCFNFESEIYIIIYDFNYDLFAHTPNYLYELLNSENIITEQFEENLALEKLDENGNIERVKGKLTISKAQREFIKNKEIFNAIANTEMGFEPIVNQLVYFFQPLEKKWFYMYDDRGCILFSHKKSDLKKIIDKFEDWII